MVSKIAPKHIDIEPERFSCIFHLNLICHMQTEDIQIKYTIKQNKTNPISCLSIPFYFKTRHIHAQIRQFMTVAVLVIMSLFIVFCTE